MLFHMAMTSGPERIHFVFVVLIMYDIDVVSIYLKMSDLFDYYLLTHQIQLEK